MTTGARSFGASGGTSNERKELFRKEGPRLEVLISKPIIAGRSSIANTSDNYIPRTALIDTGASVVCIDNRIALQLGLKATDMQTLGVVGSEIQATVYAGSLEVPELNYKKTMPMFAPRKSSLAHPILLGRSFLKDFIMTYDGPNGMFHFAEPYNFDPLNIDTA